MYIKSTLILGNIKSVETKLKQRLVSLNAASCAFTMNVEWKQKMSQV